MWTKCSRCLTGEILYAADREGYGGKVPLCGECAAETLDDPEYSNLVDALAVWKEP